MLPIKFGLDKSVFVSSYNVSLEDSFFIKRRHWKDIKILSAFFIGSLLLYYIGGISFFGLTGFLKAIFLMQETEIVSGYGVLGKILLYVKNIGIFLSPYALLYMLKYKEKKLKIYVLLIIILVATISYTRNSLAYYLIIDIFVYLYYKQKEVKKLEVKTIIAIVLLIIIFGNIFSYSQNLLNKVFDVSGNFIGMPVSSRIATLIAYFCGPLISTDIYIKSIPNIPFLGYTLRNVYDFLELLGIKYDTVKYASQDFVYIPFKFNTSTIQYYIYAEGGYIWTIIYFFSLGIVTASSWKNYYKKQDSLSLIFLSFISLLLVTMIRSYILMRLDVLIFLAIYGILKIRNESDKKRLKKYFKRESR